MMLTRLNKLELASMLLQRDPALLQPSTSISPSAAKLALESAISAQHALLALPIRATKQPTTSQKVLEANLYELSLRKNALEVELIRQTAAVTQLLEEALDVLEKKTYAWKEQQAEYLMNWFETSTLKMVAVEEMCMRQTYPPENLERLRAISSTLDKHLEDLHQSLSTKKAELVLYARLPQTLVDEYAHMNAEIAKYNDYCNRLL